MTTQQINERIAKLCGWTESVAKGDRPIKVWIDSEFKNTLLFPPDYTLSLDCCREFESPLYSGELDPEMSQYIMHLGDVVKADGSSWSWKYFRLATATPLERCEAFLRMKGQWDEN